MFKKCISALFAIALFFSLGVVTAAAQNAVYVELKTSLDTKTAKVDDPISGKLRQNVKLSDGTQLSKGALITGHVAAVKDGEGASLTLVFDKAVEGENTRAINVAIRRIDEAPVNSQDTDDDSRQIKTSGPTVSKLRGITLEAGSAPGSSGTIMSKSKSLRLEYNTLLGCVVSPA